MILPILHADQSCRADCDALARRTVNAQKLVLKTGAPELGRIVDVYTTEVKVQTQAMLVEILLSGFFALACFKARAEAPSMHGLAPQRLFMLVDRVERLRRSRWQWFAMVVLLLVLRRQEGLPLVAEFTVVAQFVLFLALPTQQRTAAALTRG